MDLLVGVKSNITPHSPAWDGRHELSHEWFYFERKNMLDELLAEKVGQPDQLHMLQQIPQIRLIHKISFLLLDGHYIEFLSLFCPTKLMMDLQLCIGMILYP